MPITHMRPLFPDWMPPKDRVRVLACDDRADPAVVWAWAANSSRPGTVLLDIALLSDETIARMAWIVAQDGEAPALWADDDADNAAYRQWVAEGAGDFARPAIKTKRTEARFSFDEVMREVNAAAATRVILWASGVGPVTDILHMARRLNRVVGVEVLVVLGSSQANDLQLVDKATYTSDDGFALRVGFDTVYRVVWPKDARAASQVS